MNHTILFVGLDVDDTRYHGCALNKHTGEALNFQCRPTLKGLLAQLNKMARHFPDCCWAATGAGQYLVQLLTLHF